MSAECSAGNVPSGYKQTEVGVIPEDWNVVILSEITSEIGDGIHATPKYFTTGDYFFINGNNIQNGCIVITKDTKSTSTSEYNKYRKNLSDKTLLLSINGTVGNVALYSGEPIFLGKSAAYLNVHGNISRLLVFYLLQTAGVITYFNEGLTGTTIKNLGLATIRSTPVPLPPTLSEQEAIAETLSDADAFIESLEQLIAKKRQIKQGAMQELLTGKRRLPGFEIKKGYKQTEVGVIPEDWLVKTIGELCSCFSGGTPSTSNSRYYGGNVAWITSSDLNSVRIKEVKGRITDEGLANSAAKIAREGTLLLALYGATAGVSAVTEIQAAINQAVLAILPKWLNTEYLFQLFQLQKDSYIKTFTQGGQPNFSGEIVKSFLISFPPTKAEQTAIAIILSDMDYEITALEEKLAKARQLKQGMMQELLTGKIRLI